MRAFTAVALLALMAACQRTPEQQRTDNQRSDAQQRGSVIENKADIDANGLQQQSAALRAGAQEVGGLTGERLKVRGDALAKEAKIVRKQGRMKADAITEETDAKIKASESR